MPRLLVRPANNSRKEPYWVHYNRTKPAYVPHVTPLRIPAQEEKDKVLAPEPLLTEKDKSVPSVEDNPPGRGPPLKNGEGKSAEVESAQNEDKAREGSQNIPAANASENAPPATVIKQKGRKNNKNEKVGRERGKSPVHSQPPAHRYNLRSRV